MGTVRALWVDGDHEAEYDTRIRRDTREFDGSFGDIAPVAFACAAWKLGVPGYVRWHRRVLDVVCARNSWDGTLTGRVTLVSPWPAALAWPRDWCRDQGWRDWPNLFGQFVHPAEKDLTVTPYLRASLLIEAPVAFAGLPAAPDGPGDAVAETARRAVSVLVRELNDLVAPIIGKLEEHLPAGSAE